MQDLTSFPIALAGAIVACLFYTPFCIIVGISAFGFLIALLGTMGIPTAAMVTIAILAMAGVGYWCIAVLFKAEVREGFNERAAAGGVQER